MLPACKSAEVNLLVYHYLKESGFAHTCFALRHEARLDDDPQSQQAVVEPGALIRTLQKGLLYLAVEAHIKPDGSESACSVPFRLLGPPHVCDGRASAPPGGDEATEPLRPSQRLTPDPDPSAFAREYADAATQTLPPPPQMNGGPKRKTAEEAPLPRSDKRPRREVSEPPQRNGTDIGRRGSISPSTEVPEAPDSDSAVNKRKKRKGYKDSQKSRPAPDSGFHPYPRQVEDGTQFTSDEVQVLTGHVGEVFVSAWNPTVPDLVASGAGDATVRIWDLSVPAEGPGPLEPIGGPAARSQTTKMVCKHLPATHAKDVSALEWNPDGTLLASGSYDGILRLWTPQGDLHLVMSMHQGPIFSVRWNRQGTRLLTGSADSTAIVWDLETGRVLQQFAVHSDSVLDVDWLARPHAQPESGWQDDIFATCSADNTINLLKLGEGKPLRVLKSHEDEVNAISFDPSSTLLASASDDMTCKIWMVDAALEGLAGKGPSPTSRRRTPDRRGATAPPSDSTEMEEREAPPPDPPAVSKGSRSAKCLKSTLTGHTKELYALSWAPTGPATANESSPRLLATASFDHTARVWNADEGTLVRVVGEHTDSVVALTWSSCARLLVTGGMDGMVILTRVRDGAVLKRFKAAGGVMDIQWHSDPSPPGTINARLSIAQQNRIVTVLRVHDLIV